MYSIVTLRLILDCLTEGPQQSLLKELLGSSHSQSKVKIKSESIFSIKPQFDQEIKNLLKELCNEFEFLDDPSEYNKLIDVFSGKSHALKLGSKQPPS